MGGRARLSRLQFGLAGVDVWDMSRRIAAGAFALSLLMVACGSTPPATPEAPVADNGPVSVLNDARDVAGDVEARNEMLESQLRDPFAQP